MSLSKLRRSRVKQIRGFTVQVDLTYRSKIRVPSQIEQKDPSKTHSLSLSVVLDSLDSGSVISALTRGDVGPAFVVNFD